MKIYAEQNQTFKSTRIPIANNKKLFMDYIDVLPPKVYKSFSNCSVEECLPKLREFDSALGLLIGKDNCFYIFGKNQSQDKFLYNRLKKVDSNVSYIKDVKD